jgi:hypothetical protein
MSNYITATDITDTQARAFIAANDYRVSTWLSRANGEIESLAQEHNVATTSIETPIHPKVKEYALAYLCMIIFQDVFTTNNVENFEMEKYKIKLDWYEARCNKLRLMITKEMLDTTNTSLTSTARVGAGRLFRS